MKFLYTVKNIYINHISRSQVIENICFAIECFICLWESRVCSGAYFRFVLFYLCPTVYCASIGQSGIAIISLATYPHGPWLDPPL
jgi:hypothetical protein